MKAMMLEGKARAELENHNIASRLFVRLRTQLPQYEWDSSTPPFHSSYDNWHVWAYLRATEHESASTPPSPANGDGTDLARHTDRLALDDNPASRQRVVARVSRHALRLEREYKLAVRFYKDARHTNVQFVKPLQFAKLPPRQHGDMPLVVMIAEAPGRNYLHEIVEFATNFYPYHPGSPSNLPRGNHRQFRGTRKKTEIPDFLDFAIGAVKCMQSLHENHGLVHGELRGDAFHFNKDTRVVMLINFGSGIRSFENGLTSAGWSSFTAQLDVEYKLQFIAPEQTGRLPAEPDSRTDIYSLGILFWTMLANEPAFAGTTPLDIMQNVLTCRIPPIASKRADLPLIISRIIQKMTQMSMLKRYQSIAGLRHDLTECKKLLVNGDSAGLDNFVIGSKDFSSEFNLPNSLIGRQKELDTLFGVIDRTSARIKGRPPAFQLSSGHSVYSNDRTDTLDEHASESTGSSDRGKYFQPVENSQETLKAQHERSSEGNVVYAGDVPPSIDGNTSGNSLGSNLRNTSITTGSSSSTSGSLLRSAQRKRNIGRCEIIAISGSTGLGKSSLLQRVQSHARGHGYYASVKFDQVKKAPFEAVFRIMASLFRQIFAENEIRTQFHDTVRSLVQPVWSSLHMALELPPWLLSPNITASLSDGGYNGPSSPPSPLLNRARKQQAATDWLYTGGGSRDRRLLCTFLDVLRLLSLQKLVSLCFDDLQYADEESLEFLHGIVSAGIPVVLITTFRTPESIPARFRTVIDSATKIELKPFTDQQTTEYVCEATHRSPQSVMPLVAVLQQKTGGNPFSIRDTLDSCHRKKLIYYSWQDSQWEFDLHKIFDLYPTSEAAECDGQILRRLQELPVESKSLLAWASLIGSNFTYTLMKYVMACDCSKKAATHLIPPRTDDPVSALQNALSAYAIMPTDEEDCFRFSHDRYLSASCALREQYSDTEMHFVIANTLIKHAPWTTGKPSKILFDQARHVCKSVEIYRQRTQTKTVRQLLAHAAELARLQGSGQMSLNFLKYALRLLPDDRWAAAAENGDVQYQDVLTLVLSTAAGHWDLGQYEQSSELIQDVLKHNSDPADRSSALILDSRIHARQGDNKAAFASLELALKDLGYTVESTTWEDCDASFHRLLPLLAAKEPDLHKISTDDVPARLHTLGAVFVEVLSAAYWSDMLLYFQLTLKLFDIYLESGPFPQLALGFIHLGTIALARFEMIAEGIHMGVLAKEIMLRSEKEPFTCGRGLTLHSLFLGHVESTFREQLPILQDAHDYAVAAGDKLLSVLNLGVIACYRLWTATDLAVVEAFVTDQAEQFPDIQLDLRGGAFLVSVRQYARALQGKTFYKHAALVMDDAEHRAVDHANYIRAHTSHSSRPLMIYDCYRFVALYKFGHGKEALSLGLSLIEPMKALLSARHVYFWMFFLGLCIFDKLRAEPDLPQRDEYIALVRDFDRKFRLLRDFNSAFCVAWLELFKAEFAERDRDYSASLAGYEAAVSGSILSGSMLEEALCYELYAEFLIRRGSSRPARSMISEAVAVYRRAGALGKADQLSEKHAFTLQGAKSLAATDAATQTMDTGTDASMEKIHRNDEDMVSQTSEDRTKAWLDPNSLTTTVSRETHNGGSSDVGNSAQNGASAGLGLDMIDLANILESSQLLSSELQFDRLLSSLTKIIVESTGADVGGVVVKEDDVGWTVAAIQSREGPIEKDVGVPLAKLEESLARQIIQYALRFRESVFIQNVLDDERFVIPPDYRQEFPEGRAITAIPVLHGDKSLLGAIYIEGPPRSFTERNTAVLLLLVNQISISITNALLFKKFEKASASNSAMLDVQKQALSQARESEKKAKMAEIQAMDMVRQKEEAAKSRDMFLANVSHELRTPLNGVIGMSELLKASVLDKEQEGYADSIRVCADTLLSVINDVLDFSKLEAGKMQMFNVQLSLNETISEVVRALSYTNLERGLRTVELLELDPKMLVMGDPVRLHQVFMNLLSNAYKFTSEGTVTVKAAIEWEDDSTIQVRCSVTDTGIGISEEQVKKLFLPFSQADSSTARSYGGTGLGLSICKAIVEKMKGRIWLESTPGRGTTVAFILPFQKVMDSQASEAMGKRGADPMAMFTTVPNEAQHTRSALPGYVKVAGMARDQLKICIAEDNPINQKIAISFVEKLGFKCEAFSDGQQAVDALEKAAARDCCFHLVLMDVQMPVLDGYRATQKIRAHPDPRVREVLIIAMTASAIRGDREKCLEAGMDNYLAKPVRAHVLKQMLEGYLNQTSKDIPDLQKQANELAKHVIDDAKPKTNS